MGKRRLGVSSSTQILSSIPCSPFWSPARPTAVSRRLLGAASLSPVGGGRQHLHVDLRPLEKAAELGERLLLPLVEGVGHLCKSSRLDPHLILDQHQGTEPHEHEPSQTARD